MRKIIRNKKADITVEKVLEMLLAVAVVVTLIILGFKLYGVMTAKSDYEQAKSHIETISAIANQLEEGESTEYVLLNPKNWMIVGWPYEGLKPKECVDNNWKNCICICSFESDEGLIRTVKKGVGVVTFTPENVLERCNQGGICKETTHSDLIVSGGEGLTGFSGFGWDISVWLGTNPRTPLLIEDHLIDEKKPLKLEVKEGDLLWITIA